MSHGADVMGTSKESFALHGGQARRRRVLLAVGGTELAHGVGS